MKLDKNRKFSTQKKSRGSLLLLKLTPGNLKFVVVVSASFLKTDPPRKSKTTIFGFPQKQ
jgi:hypothetical protein